MSDLDHEPRPPRRLWMFAAVTALALHLGGAEVVTWSETPQAVATLEVTGGIR